jgi:UDPglucose 6-dehydrogenase
MAVLGLAFKTDTGDVRQSAALRVVESLLAKGATVHVYDPLVSRTDLDLSHPRIVWANHLGEACRGCLAAVVARN